MDITTPFSIETLTANSSSLPECKPVFRVDLAIFQVIVFLDLAWNALVLWAIVKSRTKLKRNVVYSFVASLASANIALTAVFILTLFSFLTPFERPVGVSGFDESPYDHSNPEHTSIMYWYNFRKALVVGLFLAMSSNVVALINGINQNANFVGRSGATTAKGRSRQRIPSVTRSKEEQTNSMLTRHQKASFSILLAWIVPLVYTLLSFARTDCIEYCDCLPGYYSKQYFCSRPRGQIVNTCSNVWNPMTNGYLLVAVTIWFVDSIAIFVLLAKAFEKYRSVMKPINNSLSPSTKATLSSSNNRDINENKSITGVETTSCSTISSQPKNATLYGSSGTLNGSIGTTIASMGSNHGAPSNGALSPAARFSLKRKSRLHPTIKLLIALSVSYTLCTAPMMLCFAIDAFVDSQNAVDDISVTISSVIIIIYTVMCPGFLVAYMPGLRKALISFLMPLTCTTTTTVVHRVARLATTKKK